MSSQYNSLTRGARVKNASGARGVKEGKGKERNITTNTNPVSKALPSKKEAPQNIPSYKENIKQVMDYYNNLKPEQKNLFALGALGLRGHGVPSPKMDSTAMKQLMVLWYGKTVEPTGEKRL